MQRELSSCSNDCRQKAEGRLDILLCDIEHQVRNLKKGMYVANQGDTVSHLLFLTEGMVRTEMISGSGLVMPIEELSAPYPLAAGFLFANDNRFPVDVIAKEDCKILMYSKEAIERRMMQSVDFLRGFMAFNANRMCFLSDRLRIFALKGIKAKFAYYVMRREKDGVFVLGRSMADLAGYFAVERPSLSRAVAEMVHEGIIAFEAGKGKIIDFSALRKLM